MPLPLRRSGFVALLATVALLIAAPVASALPFTNWDLTGSLTIAKLKQTVTFPAGSKFNGNLDLTEAGETGR